MSDWLWPLNDLFEQDDPKAKIVDPLASHKVEAADYLRNLLSAQVPRQGVAGLSETERFGQDYLRDYVKGGMPSSLGSAEDYYARLLNQPADITQLPEYGAIMKTVGAETDEAVNRLMRRLQLSGMSRSTPQGRGVGREVALGGQKMLAQLGPYAEAERNRQMNAANMLAQLAQLREALQQGRLGSIQQYGGLPRQLDQAELNAIFNQAMGPFTTKAPVAQGLLGQGVEYTVQQQPSIMEQIAPAIGPAMMALMASDERVKENIEDLGSATRKIKKIHAKVYNYKGTDPIERRAGVIAQDVERVLPEAVKEINGIKHVDYAAIAALATEAVNELIDEVKKLKGKKVA